ncbi:MAG: OmpH family outer membrane protein [bacterium]
MKFKTTIISVILPALFLPLFPDRSPLTSPLAALEISLEENRGELGSAGYVDIEAVFREFPGTLKAKAEFQTQVQKKEKAINEKKSEIFALKAEINRLRQEKEFAARLPMKVAPVSTTASGETPAPGISTPPAAADETAVSAVTAAEIAVSSASEDGSPVSALSAPASVSTETAAAGKKIAVLDLPGIKNRPVDSIEQAPSELASELEDIIRVKEAELADKEASLRGFQRQVERELIDYESRKTEIILGSIYQSLKELAASEGISVVVDKRSILYGQSAVNLTEKLIKKLHGF